MYANEYGAEYQWYRESEPKADGYLARVRYVVDEKGPTKKFNDLCQICPSDYLHRCWIYFWAKGEKLRCLEWHIELTMTSENWSEKDRTVIRQYWPELQTEKDQNDVMGIIYRYLKSKKTTKYYEALQEFKWRAGFSRISFFEERRLLGRSQGRLFYQKGHDRALLTDEFVNGQLMRCGAQGFSDSTLKSKLAKEIIKYHEEKQADTKKCVFAWGNTVYDPITGRIRVHRNSDGIYRPQPERWGLSANGTSCLRELLSNSIDMLNDFAVFLAKLCAPDRTSDYMWIATGEQQDLDHFMQFIAMLFPAAFYEVNLKYRCAIFEKKTDRRAILLAEGQLLQYPFQVNEKIMDRDAFREVNFERLKKFIQGEKVGEIEDPYVVTEEGKSVFGRGVLLYRTLEYDASLFRRIPHKVFRIPSGWKPNFTENDIMWLVTALVCHGIHVMDRSSIGDDCEEKLDAEGAVERFLKEYIRKDATDYIDAKTMHQRFEEYAEACLGMRKADLRIADANGKVRNLGSTIFGKRADQILGVVRIELRRNGNRLAYEGFSIDEERLKFDIEQAKKENAKIEKNFDEVIDQMADLVAIERW